MSKKNISDWELALLGLDKSQWRAVSLRCDDYKVSFRNEMDEKRRVQIMCFVNGEFRGEWSNVDSEIGKKFFRPFCVRPQKYLLDYYYLRNDTKGAMEYRQRCAIPTHYSPFFKTPSEIIKKLKSTCTNISLISC